MESSVTFEAFFRAFLEEKKKSNLKVTAHETLRQNAECVDGCLGEVIFRGIDSDMVQQMIFDRAAFSRSIGHSSIRTTVEIYAHLDMTQNRYVPRSADDVEEF